MVEITGFVPRKYQEEILETCKQKNTLLCLPTGLGKTKSAIMLSVHRLQVFPESKVVVCSPTKPLANQICEEFKECTTVDANQIVLLTGATKPEERKKAWANARIIVATPQTIQSDVAQKRFGLEDVSLLCIDECHRSKDRFANTIVTKYYRESAKNSLVLALTASPGATKEKIDMICRNLGIEAIELRSENDEGVKEYVQEKNAEHIQVMLPEKIRELQGKIREVYQQKIRNLQSFGLVKPAKYVNKRDLLFMQKKLQTDIGRGNRAAFSGISTVAQALKLSHLLEIIETQSLKSAKEFLEKLKQEKTKAAQIISNDKTIVQVGQKLEALVAENVKHPKMEKIAEIIGDEVQRNPQGKSIVFANFRGTVDELVEHLKKNQQVRPVKLIGQKEGLTQKQQIETINKFAEGEFNCLVGTQILEEGLDVKGGAELAIFYDPGSGSEIRKIQRSGRVGRMKPGRVIFLITKETRDEAYFWAAHQKEKKMQNLLSVMKKKQENQVTLT